jgi:hypothetical protein
MQDAGHFEAKDVESERKQRLPVWALDEERALRCFANMMAGTNLDPLSPTPDWADAPCCSRQSLYSLLLKHPSLSFLAS